MVETKRFWEAEIDSLRRLHREQLAAAAEQWESQRSLLQEERRAERDDFERRLQQERSSWTARAQQSEQQCATLRSEVQELQLYSAQLQRQNDQPLAGPMTQYMASFAIHLK